MSNRYETRYGVTFGGHHSFRDYRLLPTSAPVITPPKVNTYFVDVPGADGSLDLTEALTGYPTYGDRQGTFNYQIYAPKSEWDSVVDTLTHDLHGKRMDVVLDENNQYYYRGRLTVGTPSYGKFKATISVTGVFGANRYMFDEYSGNNWLWNPFDFDSGIAREYYKISVRNTKTVTLIGSDLIVCPKFTLESGNMTMVCDGVKYPLTRGDNYFLNVMLSDDEKQVTFIGRGVVTITYRIGGVG